MTARISPSEAHARMTDEGYVYLDVRTEAEFAAGHPAGAYNVPVMLEAPTGLVANPDFAHVVERVFPSKDAALVVGCKAGGRSARAAKLLGELGYARILDQRAGWDGARGAFGEITEPGWSRVGLPREDGQPDARSYDALTTAASGS